MVDHKNNNGLDNQRDNLRPATYSTNQFNQTKRANRSSQYKGVYLHKSRGKWMARIRKMYKETFLGYFDNEIDAAKAYDVAAKQMFGEYAKLNF